MLCAQRVGASVTKLLVDGSMREILLAESILKTWVDWRVDMTMWVCLLQEMFSCYIGMED